MSCLFTKKLIYHISLISSHASPAVMNFVLLFGLCCNGTRQKQQFIANISSQFVSINCQSVHYLLWQCFVVFSVYIVLQLTLRSLNYLFLVGCLFCMLFIKKTISNILIFFSLFFFTFFLNFWFSDINWLESMTEMLTFISI